MMNQLAGDRDAIIGDFTGTTIRYAGGEARFHRDAQGPVMELRGPRGRVRYRVTRTVGRRALQEYVGVADGTTEAVRLPFAWWPRLRGWFPQPAFDPWLDETGFDAYEVVREPWAARCPWCHSTYPAEQRIARSNALGVGHGLEQFFASRAGAPPPTVERLDVSTQVSIGISCESCHLGGKAHADGAAIHFVPQGAVPRPGATGVPTPTSFTAERADPAIVNRVCAQCHSGPSPRLPDGTALRNSSEALDLAASACTTARCVDCHDPHAGGVDDSRAIAACTRCHVTVSTLGRTHTGHDRKVQRAGPRSVAAGDAEVDAATCLDCHMPRIVMGIDRFVRTHRISSPTDPRVLGAGGPNACNLCHLDRSMSWTLDELAAQYDVHLDRRREAWSAYRDLGEPVGAVWLASTEPAVRLIAASAYARAPRLAPFARTAIATGLDDRRAYVRAWMLIFLEDVLGHPVSRLDYDPLAPAASRRRAVRGLLDKLR